MTSKRATGRSSRDVLQPIDFVALTAAALMAGVIVGGVDNGATTNDFRTFYLTAHAWRLGLPRPELLRPDLKPPTFSVLFWPLTFVSEHAARAAWTAVSIAAWLDALRRIRKATVLGTRRLLWLACGCIAAMPAAVAWQLGQVTWILLWLVTRAWLASASSATRAGIWLGLAIAIQPTFALMAILLPAAIWIPAAMASAGMSAAALAITGVGAWREWIALSRNITWLPFPLNASLWGLVARIQSRATEGLGFASMNHGAIVAVAATGIALASVTLRARGNRRWVLAGLFGVLLSPLGWTHYLPTLLGPAIATRSSYPRALAVGIVLLAVPLPLLAAVAHRNTLMTIAIGSTYGVGVCLLWIAWASEKQQDPAFDIRNQRARDHGLS